MLLGPRESILTPYFLGPLDITSLMSFIMFILSDCHGVNGSRLLMGP